MTKTRQMRKIGLRELSRNTKMVREALERGEGFILLANGTAVGTISPIKKKKTKTKEDFFKLIGSIKGVKGLTNEEIDRLIYDL